MPDGRPLEPGIRVAIGHVHRFHEGNACRQDEHLLKYGELAINLVLPMENGLLTVLLPVDCELAKDEGDAHHNGRGDFGPAGKEHPDVDGEEAHNCRHATHDVSKVFEHATTEGE